MLNTKSLFALALIGPLLGVAIPAQAANSNVTAARAACFQKANEAASASGNGNFADRNSMGQDAYRQCCFKAGIRSQLWRFPRPAGASLRASADVSRRLSRLVWETPLTNYTTPDNRRIRPNRSSTLSSSELRSSA